MTDKGRIMQIMTAPQMRQAIIQLTRRVEQLEEWQAMDAELAAHDAQMTLQETNVKPSPATHRYVEQVEPATEQAGEAQASSRKHTASVIEEHIRRNIANWKWTREIQPGVVACPLTASDMAQRLNLDTDEVRKLIRDPSLWPNVVWRRRMLPDGHPEANRCNVAMHVVTADYR